MASNSESEKQSLLAVLQFLKKKNLKVKYLKDTFKKFVYFAGSLLFYYINNKQIYDNFCWNCNLGYDENLITFVLISQFALFFVVIYK